MDSLLTFWRQLLQLQTRKQQILFLFRLASLPVFDVTCRDIISLPRACTHSSYVPIIQIRADLEGRNKVAIQAGDVDR